jgi:hypothetical protein
LNESLFFRLAREIGVAVSCLRFTTESGQDIFLGLRSFQAFHDSLSSWVFFGQRLPIDEASARTVYNDGVKSRRNQA